jgi:hypothetical protein
MPRADVSVITPSYNYEPFLASCLRSVQQQRGRSQVQHVVIDDGSADGSWRLVQEVHSSPDVDARTRPNKGLSATLNDALDLARGDWLLWLNSDDLLLPWSVELLERALDQVPDADLVVGDTVLVDDRTRYRRLVARSHFDRRVAAGGFNPFFVSSVFWRRDRLPGWRFDESMQLLMDLDLWLALTVPGSTVVKVAAPMSLFREHGGQISATARPTDVTETRLLGERYDLSELRRAQRHGPTPAARRRHAISRVTSGAVLRELRARSLRGSALDWPVGAADTTALQALDPGIQDPLVHVTRT